MSDNHADDELEIVDDLAIGTGLSENEGHGPWRILIVDDDTEVHDATVFALNDVLIDGRPLHFLHAYSACEAISVIRGDADIAVVILDVVMESESAGLDVVRAIRNDLGRAAIRIILRTGQPGYAPEMQVIRDYDINDYKTKTELTRVRLLTTLTTAIRFYAQLQTIISSRRGLSNVIDTAAKVLTHRDIQSFANAVTQGVVSLLATPGPHPPEAFLCAQSKVATADLSQGNLIPVIGASQAFASRLGHPLQAQDSAEQMVQRCLAERAHQFEAGQAALHIPVSDEHDAALYLSLPSGLTPENRQLLEVFCISVGVGLGNAQLIADISYAAYADQLTGLGNRAGFVLRIDEHLHTQRPGWSIALIDIDHFSEINDALGHQQGDQVLKAIAQRLTHSLPPEAILARVSGDVFGILAPEEHVTPERFIRIFETPFTVGNYSLPVQITMGLARLDEAACDDGLDLLKATSIALNIASNGRQERWHYYTRDMAIESRHRLDLLNNLRLAVEQRKGLELHYQPQVEILTGRVIGAEALIRWRGDDGKFIRPDLFISLAEYSGLIVELGAWVFETAIQELRSWEQLGLSDARIAINVSLVQFRDPNFLPRIREVIKKTGVPPGRIELEITESVAILDTTLVISILSELKSMGFMIAIDDFGTGFSSLSYLHRLPIDQLKIDRSFVNDLGSMGSTGANIAHTIIRLGQALNLSVLAEGIETEDQLKLLQELGCPLAQGYLYSKPVDSASFVAWWQARQPH